MKLYRYWIAGLSMMAAVAIMAAVLAVNAYSSDTESPTETGFLANDGDPVSSAADPSKGETDVDEGFAAAALLAERFPLVEFAPRASEEIAVSRSQLIVMARATAVIGDELIPPRGAVPPPSDTEPLRGVRTRKYTLTVERYIKGNAPEVGNTIVLQVLSDYVQIPLDEPLLLFLAPYMAGTYQAGFWTTMREQDGRVRTLLGNAVPRASGITLDGYAEHLESVVRGQAESGPVAALAVPSVLAGETIRPTQLLGLQNTRTVRVTGPDGLKFDLNAENVAALLQLVDQPMRVEAATRSLSARSVHVTVTLEDGHVWEFDYDPATGTFGYAPANLQVQFSASAKETIDSIFALAE